MNGVNRLALYSWGQDPDFRPSCRLQTSDQVRSLRDNTIVQSAFKALYTVQPNIAIPLYNPHGHVIVQPIWFPTTVQSAIKALDTAQPNTAMYCTTPMVASIVQPIGPLHCTNQMQPTSVQGSTVTPLYSHYGFPRHTAGHCGLGFI